MDNGSWSMVYRPLSDIRFTRGRELILLNGVWFTPKLFKEEAQYMDCPICSWTPDNPDYLLLSETQYWRVCLAPNQSLLGRCAIHLKRHAGDLADLTESELLEFLSVVKLVEASMKSAFGADRKSTRL